MYNCTLQKSKTNASQLCQQTGRNVTCTNVLQIFWNIPIGKKILSSTVNQDISLLRGEITFNLVFSTGPKTRVKKTDFLPLLCPLVEMQTPEDLPAYRDWWHCCILASQNTHTLDRRDERAKWTGCSDGKLPSICHNLYLEKALSKYPHGFFRYRDFKTYRTLKHDPSQTH